MKAAVCYEQGKPLVVEDVDIVPTGKGEVKIRLSATAICHSDLHFLNGDVPFKVPGLAGHESAGYVEEVGENVTSVKPGDPVVVTVTTKGCGQCYYCNIGIPHLCDNAVPWQPHHLTKKGEGIMPMAGPVGGFAEYTVVSEYQIVKIAEDMPIDRAALLSCAVMTGFGSVVNRAKVKPLESVVVMGTGGVGLNAIQGAAYSGAYPVIAVDILDSKLKAARTFGATHTINTTKEEDPVKKVKELTWGRGADYAFITVGNSDALRLGVLMSGKRGMTVIVGMSGGNLPIGAMNLVDGERMLAGCMLGSARLSVDIPALVSLYQAGRLKLDELITKRYPLEQINEAIESFEKGRAIRNVIIF